MINKIEIEQIQPGSGSTGDANKILKVDSTGETFELVEEAGGAATFLDLTDTPVSFSGSAGLVVAVNSGSTGLEFKEVSGAGNISFLDLTDTPVSFSGSAGMSVLINNSGDALAFGPPQFPSYSSDLLLASGSVNPYDGQLAVTTHDYKLNIYSSVDEEWQKTTSFLAEDAAKATFKFDGDGAETDFDVEEQVAMKDVLVTVNGLVQLPTEDYTMNLSEISFNSAPTSGSVIGARVFARAPGTAALDENYWGDGSDGNLTTSADVNIPSVEDGDMVFKQYNNLTISAGDTLTVANRCKGLVLYVKGNLVVNGTISMKARGANLNAVSEGVAAGGITLARISDLYADSGSPVFTGCGSAIIAKEANQTAVSANGKVISIPRAGGTGATAFNNSEGPGTNGGTSTNGTGGGGSGMGTYDSADPGDGGDATCFSGGSGGGGSRQNGNAGNAADDGGAGGAGATDDNDWGCGGGAGNPPGAGNGTQGDAGGVGTGGILIIFVRGSITIGAAGVIEADGMPGGEGRDLSNGCAGGAGSGGGVVAIFHGGTLTNGGAINANGGAGAQGWARSGSWYAGDGGAGSVLGPYQCNV